MAEHNQRGRRRPRRKTRLRVRLIATTVYVLLLAGMVEFGARGFLAYFENVRSVSPSTLDDYEVANPAATGSWQLKNGFQATLDQAIAGKQRTGKVLGVSYLKTRARHLDVAPDDVILQINSSGFVGPELDETRTRRRVLCLGDSCTFGSLFNQHCYSRVMEREFAQLGHEIEVVNGGVEGYSPRHVLQRIDQFKALQPDVTTIYLGWNALYSDKELAVVVGGVKYRFATLLLASKAWNKVGSWGSGQQQDAMQQYAKQKESSGDSALFAALERHSFSSILSDVEQIVDEMQSVGSRVVLLTLPALFVPDEVPSSEALSAGHLPHFTNDPRVVAKIVAVYNRRLRDMAAKRGLQVVDLETWGKSNLQPREQFFFDTCHLFEEGQQMLGQKIARDLVGDGPIRQAANRDQTVSR